MNITRNYMARNMQENIHLNKKRLLGITCLLITVLLFSSYEVVNKLIIGKVGALQLNFLRFFIGGFILFLILVIRKDVKITPRLFLRAGLVGIINVVVSMGFLQLALASQESKASVVAVIFSSNPIFVVLICALIGREKLTLRKTIGMIIGFTGVVVALTDSFDIATVLKISSLYALLSALFYAIYTVYGRAATESLGSLKMNAYSFLIGSVCLIPILLIKGEHVFVFDVSAIPYVIYLSVFVSGLAYFTYFIGLKIVGVGMGSLVFFLKPVISSIFAFFILGESITINLILGIILILAGIGIAREREKKIDH